MKPLRLQHPIARKGYLATWAAFFWGLLGALFCGPLVFLPVEQADLALKDFMVRSLPSAPAHPDLVFLSLDEGCFNLSHLEPEEIAASPALQAMESDFPWSRMVYAEMLERLFAAGAERVVLDVHFPIAGEGDEALAQVVRRYPGRVVFGSVLDHREEADGSLSVVYSPPAASVGWSEGGAEGFVNFWPDRDGVVRTVDYRISLSQAKGSEARTGETLFSSLAAVTLETLAPALPLPQGAALMRFVRPGTFPTYPLWQIFVPAFWESNLDQGAVFRGKTVVFGATAARFRDYFRTPVLAAMPGAELHLNAISAALQGQFFYLPPWWISSGLCFVASFAALGAFRGQARPWQTLLGFLLLFLGAMGLIWLVAAMSGYLLPPAPLLGTMAASATTAFGARLVSEFRERTRVRGVLERYVSRQIVREVLDHPSSFLNELGGTRKEVVVLFSDLRGFTSLTESADPAELVVQLNEYLGTMVKVIFDHGGTIDKFMGDAVMAVWGSVGSQGRDVDIQTALAAAEAMPQRLADLNANWEKQGKPPLRLGIGLHAGEAIFGNIGSPQKMELTVIGDTVNLASRLEGACKFYQVPLIFSARVRQSLRPDAPVLPLDLLRVKGRKEAVEIFTCSAGLEKIVNLAELLVIFPRAVAAYRSADFTGCLELLSALPPDCQQFPPVEIYRERCRQWMSTDMPENWSPVVEANSK